MNGFSVREIIEKVKQISKKDFLVNEEPRRDGDPDVLIASSEKAKQELGFSTKYSTLEAIIKSLL